MIHESLFQQIFLLQPKDSLNVSRNWIHSENLLTNLSESDAGAFFIQLPLLGKHCELRASSKITQGENNWKDF